MAPNPRYAALVAILDDPLNRACIERELVRRQEKAPSHRGFLPPPIPREGDGGVVYLSMEEYQRTPRTLLKNGEEAHTEYLLDVFEGTEGWLIIREDLSEIGPLPTLDEAQKEAHHLLESQGYQILAAHPWVASDTKTYPLASGRKAMSIPE